MSEIIKSIVSDQTWCNTYLLEKTVKGKLNVINHYVKAKGIILKPLSKERWEISKAVWRERWNKK